ncbi:hypothetical protein MRB53_021629 [Persea americana]|uniref:Uncharacterized protein n=1 Tax=Persea americana TaxID=3435 RepID=A0ACC2L5F0_PERAE|nr:hypothetical protein MRB53_021629 [Persea americana]
MGSKNSTMSPGSFSKNNSKAEVHPYVESMAKGIITNRMVAEPYGVSRTQSFWDSLSEIPCIISEINEEAVKSVLDCLEQNKDMRKNKDLLHLVKLYYSNSFIMSQLCNELENCLTIARDRQLTLRAAVQFFKEEQGSWENKNDRYVQALEELKKFKNAENPFSNFSQILKKVREQQQSLCDELGLHYKSIKMKLVILKVFRGVCRAIFWLINFAIVVCQVVLPFAGHNDLAAALGSAGAGAGLSALGGTVDLQFKSYHNELSREMELISSIEECARDGHHEMGQLVVSLYVYVVCSSLPPWFGAVDVNDIR